MKGNVEDLLEPGHAWAERVRGRLAGLTPELTDLVLHLAACDEFWTWRCKNDGVWKRRTKALLKVDGAPELVRAAIREMTACGSLYGTVGFAPGAGLSRVAPTRSLACGFVLAAGCLGGRRGPGEENAGLVADLAVVGRRNSHAAGGNPLRDDELAGAAFTALGDLYALDALYDLHRVVPGPSHCHAALVRALKKTAKRFDVPPHRLAERMVPTHGLGADRTMRLGPPGVGAIWLNLPFEAVVGVDDDGRVTLDWIDEDGTTTRSTWPFRSPSGFNTRYLPHNVEGARLVAQGIGKTLVGERARLLALSDGPGGESWPAAEWARYYRDHPVTGVLVRGLVWECGEGTAGEGAAGEGAAGEGAVGEEAAGEAGTVWTAGVPAPGGGWPRPTARSTRYRRTGSSGCGVPRGHRRSRSARYGRCWRHAGCGSRSPRCPRPPGRRFRCEGGDGPRLLTSSGACSIASSPLVTALRRGTPGRPPGRGWRPTPRDGRSAGRPARWAGRPTTSPS
ncbi:hypothetical protein ACQEVS_21090 [Streptomyces sp. CA-181903]|uniref:hypothetical protein n=1 Tax=Streptomyces sp. CA-181903 TaxID=3240055 RepID=UPI003D8C1728